MVCAFAAATVFKEFMELWGHRPMDTEEVDRLSPDDVLKLTGKVLLMLFCLYPVGYKIWHVLMLEVPQ